MSNMEAFREEHDHLRTMIESMTKSYRSYTLTMKDKKGTSTFNTIGPLSCCLDSWFRSNWSHDTFTIALQFICQDDHRTTH